MFCRPFTLCVLSCISETMQVTEGLMLASSVLYHSSLKSRLTSSSCVILLSLLPEFYFILPIFLLFFFLSSSALSYFFFTTRYVVFILIFAILLSPSPLPTFSYISMSILWKLITVTLNYGNQLGEMLYGGKRTRGCK